MEIFQTILLSQKALFSDFFCCTTNICTVQYILSCLLKKYYEYTIVLLLHAVKLDMFYTQKEMGI